MKKTTFIATKKKLDEVYEIGLKNGGIYMKNEILKKLNRDWKLWGFKKENVELGVKVLKKINRIKVPSQRKISKTL